MLKRLRKRLKERELKKSRRLAAALCAVAVLAGTPAPAWADTGPQTFSDGQPHTVTDNIVADWTIGLDVMNSGTRATMNGWSITATNNVCGAHVWNGGAFSLTNVAINATNSFAVDSIGLEAEGAGSTITMRGGSLNVTGFYNYGAYAKDGGAISLANVAVITSGNHSFGGLAAQGAGSTVTMTGGAVTSDGIGVDASAGGAISLTNTAVTATGNGDCLAASGAGSGITMTGGSITTTGGGNVGAHAGSGGAISLTNVAVTTTGLSAYGLLIHNGGAITMTGGSVATSGTGSLGAYVWNGGAITLTNAAVTTSGTNSHGLYVNGAGGTITATNASVATSGSGSHGAYALDGAISLTNTSVTSSGYGLFASAGTINATVNGQDISGAAGLLVADNGGTVSLTANGGSRLSGATSTSGGGTSTLTLNNSTWTNTGNGSNLTTLAMSGGRVAFSAPSSGAYKTLTLGTLAGSSGSFYLNANVAADKGDSIAVTASAAGSHNLYVRDWGGTPGDLHKTVRLTNITGIDNAVFGGGGDVGAWRYGVGQGSALSGYTVSGNASDYYLYNTFAPSTPVRAAMSQSAGATVAWYGEMNEIKKRMGDLRMGTQAADGFWVRTYAEKFGVRPGGGDSFVQAVRGIELGRDNPQAFAGGKKYTGFVLGAGRADNTFAGGGTGDTDSIYAGAYGSWLRDDGSYFDLVGKYNRFRHSFTAPLLGGGSDSGSYRNTGLGLSAEIGKRFERGNGVYVQPEAELSAFWAGRASYKTTNGLSVETPAVNSLQLRLGVTVGQKRTDADGVTRQVYAKAGWVNEYRGDSRMVVDGAAFDASLKGHQWVGGVGYIEDDGRRQLYIDVEKSWGNTVSKSWGGNAGCRWRF